MKPQLPIASLVACWLSLICSGTAIAQTSVFIADPNLEAVLRQTLQKPLGLLTEADLEGLTELHADSLQITNLAGLESARHLQNLQLSANSISNIVPLTGLQELVQLNLSLNPLRDLTPLTSLTNLELLQVRGAQVNDIGALRGLTSLATLDIGDNHATDFSALAGLTNLVYLDLGSNLSGDLIALVGLSKLRNLLAYNLGLTAAGTLTGLTNLQSLTLAVNRISNLTPLFGLKQLEDLDLSENPLTNLTALVGLSSLSRLTLERIGLTNLEPLAAITQLTSLDLEGNQVTDTTPLAALTNLSMLNLENNSINNASPLVILTNLTSFDLAFNSVTNYPAIGAMTNLTQLHLEADGISDLSFIQKLTWLQELGLTYNHIRDLGPLTALTNLMWLYLDNNMLSDVSVLRGLPNVRVLSLYENLLDLTDGSSALQAIQALSGRGVTVYYQPQSQAPQIFIRSNWLIAANQRSSFPLYLDCTVPPGIPPTCSPYSSNPALVSNVTLIVTTPIPGVYDWNLSVTPAKDQTGSDDVVLSATNWAGLWTNVTIHIVVTNPVPFAGQQLDSPDLLWSTAGDPLWSSETTFSHDGKGAAQSGATDSWIQTRVTGPGTLGFWWKLASDSTYGFGQFTATAQDSPREASLNLPRSDQWEETVLGIPAGDWVLNWSPLWGQWYDWGIPTALWLDQVSFTPGPGACRLSLAPAWEHTPDGNFWVDVMGEDGASYDIEVSTNLVVWSPLTRVTCLKFQAGFSDWNTTASARFYRAKRMP